MADVPGAKAKKRKLPPWMTSSRNGPNASTVNANDNQKKPLPDSANAPHVMLSQSNLEYAGKVIYSYQKDDCSLLVQDLREQMTPDSPVIVGFDMEWPVTYRAGSESKTALIQLCTSRDTCYLFHVACMGGLPRLLKEFLECDEVCKVGIGIESDIWKLARDFDFPARTVIGASCVDLSKLANQILGSSERWSLDNLCRNVLHKCLSKETNIRCGDWREYPLSEQQKHYAALDAYASLVLYEELIERRKTGR